jgi:hypothetical protein
MRPPAAVLNCNGKRTKPTSEDTRILSGYPFIQGSAYAQSGQSSESFQKEFSPGKACVGHTVQTRSSGRVNSPAGHQYQDESVLTQQVGVVQVRNCPLFLFHAFSTKYFSNPLYQNL